MESERLILKIGDCFRCKEFSEARAKVVFAQDGSESFTIDERELSLDGQEEIYAHNPYARRQKDRAYHPVNLLRLSPERGEAVFEVVDASADFPQRVRARRIDDPLEFVEFTARARYHIDIEDKRA